MRRSAPIWLFALCVLLYSAIPVVAETAEDESKEVAFEAVDVAPRPVDEPEAAFDQSTQPKPEEVDEGLDLEMSRPELSGDLPGVGMPEEGTIAEEPLEVPSPIVDIQVDGNDLVSAEDILKVVKSQVGGQFSEADVARDRQAILGLGWFKTVSVQRESVENGIRLIFRVIENPVITDIQFEGNRELTREQLLSVIQTKPGEIYSAPLILQDAQTIEKSYRSQGYILAIVVDQRMSAEGILTLTIAEGQIEDIKITGNTHTKTYAIRRYIRTQVGETYNDRKVQRDIQRLSALGWFETVRRDAEIGAEPGSVVVIITVVEKRRTGMASVGGGYSSVQGIVGFIDLTKSNIGGNGQVVSVRGEFGGRTSYEFGYQHPWIMTPETRLSAGIYNRLILREAFVTDDEGERRDILYDERRDGGNITFGRPLSDHTTVFLGFRSDDVSIEGVSEEEEGYLTGAAFEPRKVRSITVAAVNDTRSDAYNPRRGGYQRLSTEFAGLLFGGSEFNKYVLDTRRFFPIGAKNTVAMRLLAGTVTGDPPYLEQFLVGGSESLRGYRSDRFAGTRMAILNAEYRFPLTENLLGVAFVDVGDAWGGPIADDPAFEDIVHESFTAHLGYGFGVRVKTPIGPLRLDLGFSEEGTETHFGVRHMF